MHRLASNGDQQTVLSLTGTGRWLLVGFDGGVGWGSVVLVERHLSTERQAWPQVSHWLITTAGEEERAMERDKQGEKKEERKRERGDVPQLWADELKPPRTERQYNWLLSTSLKHKTAKLWGKWKKPTSDIRSTFRGYTLMCTSPTFSGVLEVPLYCRKHTTPLQPSFKVKGKRRMCDGGGFGRVLEVESAGHRGSLILFQIRD